MSEDNGSVTDPLSIRGGRLFIDECDAAALATLCAALPRHNDPKTVKFTCVPGTTKGIELSTCHQELMELGIGFTLAANGKASPKGKPNLVCDIKTPIYVSPIMYGVSYLPSSPKNKAKKMYVTCPLALAMAKAAKYAANHGIASITHYGTYNCRVISGTSILSQHGLANAIDIAGVVTLGGTYWTLLKDWEKDKAFPVTTAGKFLKDWSMWMHVNKVFNVILTPDYNAAHANHFHVDLTPGSNFLK